MFHLLGSLTPRLLRYNGIHVKRLDLFSLGWSDSILILGLLPFWLLIFPSLLLVYFLFQMFSFQLWVLLVREYKGLFHIRKQFVPTLEFSIFESFMGCFRREGSVWGLARTLFPHLGRFNCIFSKLPFVFTWLFRESKFTWKCGDWSLTLPCYRNQEALRSLWVLDWFEMHSPFLRILLKARVRFGLESLSVRYTCIVQSFNRCLIRRPISFNAPLFTHFSVLVELRMNYFLISWRVPFVLDPNIKWSLPHSFICADSSPRVSS